MQYQFLWGSWWCHRTEGRWLRTGYKNSRWRGRTRWAVKRDMHIWLVFENLWVFKCVCWHEEQWFKTQCSPPFYVHNHSVCTKQHHTLILSACNYGNYLYFFLSLHNSWFYFIIWKLMYKQGTDGSSRKWKQFVVMGEVGFGDSTLAESENVFIFSYNHSTA